MPQMAPLSWLLLFIYFLLLFLLFNISNYYSFIYSIQLQYKTKKKTFFNWKW